jgi:hypothetical protein
LVLIFAMAAKALQGRNGEPRVNATGATMPEVPDEPRGSKLDLIGDDWQQWALPGFVDEDPAPSLSTLLETPPAVLITES